MSANAVTRDLVAYARLELIPTASLDRAMAELPPASRVSVTCSPTKGIDTTLEATARLLDAGHDVIPHIAARLVEDRRHVTRLARWTRTHAVTELFVIAGDAKTARGPFSGALPFLRELFEHHPGVHRVGIAAYPDGHPFIPRSTLSDALHAKQDLFTELGIVGTATTQMCFDGGLIRAWLQRERARGMTLHTHVGIPGVVDRMRLVAMGTQVGVGASLRYVSKNRSSMKRVLAPGGYDPTALLETLAAEAYPLGITGVHAFTFNNIADTVAWQLAVGQRPSGASPGGPNLDL